MSDFRRQLDNAYKVKVEGALEKTVRKVALAVDAQLVLTTPVDTGRARSNWISSLNTPDVRIVEPGTVPNIPGVAEKYTLSDTILITNSLPYIKPLNEGHSKQAPAGFVELAVQAGVDAVNR